VNRVELEGRGLLGGGTCRVVLARTDRDDVRVSAGGSPFVRVGELRVVASAATTRTTTVGCGTMKLALVEHLFAALAGASVRTRLDIQVSGDEMPLLDGGAATWCAALAAIGLGEDLPSSSKPHGARLRVLAPGDVDVGESVYRFSVSPDVNVRVEIDFGDARIAPTAQWGGESKDFVSRIASARTFLRFADADAMLAAGLAAEVDPESVVVLADDAIHAAGRAFEADEPARHKLLDLLGDLYVHGGPPFGTVHARRPGHAATHRAIALALERGILGAW
jgi:UDP-3-O-[3-hydroxymyristoyl] N-acetylglucosamine deacetylase